MLNDSIAKGLSDDEFERRIKHTKVYTTYVEPDDREALAEQYSKETFRDAVLDVRRAIEVEGAHWEAACDRVISLYPLGLVQIADIYAEAERRYG